MVMKVFYLKPDSSYSLESSVCAIGYFDGVHLGHQQLLKRVEKIAQVKNMKKALMTFSCHPKEILGKKDFKYLMSLQSKIAILEKEDLTISLLLNLIKKFLNIHLLHF